MSISGPGFKPTINMAPSSSAMAPLPGMPNAMVGIKSPPRVELFARAWTEKTFDGAFAGARFVF